MTEPGIGIPLNSRRITLMQIRMLARGLDLPTSGTREDTLQMLNEKIREKERQPSDILVLEGEAAIQLLDADGLFLEIPIAEHPADDVQGLETSPVEEMPTEVDELKDALQQLSTEKAVLETELDRQKREAQHQKDRYKALWRTHCELLGSVDDKNDEIRGLKDRIAELEKGTNSMQPTGGMPSALDQSVQETHTMAPGGRKGRAPPVDPFCGDSIDVTFEDWLPSLERAAVWNSWTEEESLLQLAGYLRGRAFQEWNLLQPEERQDYKRAVQEMAKRLDPGSRSLAAQDFRHTRQRDAEIVADFIRRLEKTFQVAYGKDGMSSETRQMLLYSQLQEGLSDELMRSPAVSGALTYTELCIAAKNEEKRRAELAKRNQYRRPNQQKPSEAKQGSQQKTSGQPQKTTNTSTRTQQLRRCYNCGSTQHLQKDCKAPSSESKGKTPKPAQARQVTVNPPESDPLTYLASDSDDENVRRVTVEDQGSQPKCAGVLLQGVPMHGVVDTGSDITILGGDAFRKVATVAKLRKKDFKPADKKAFNYDGKPFCLDGCMQLEVTFGEQTMATTVYVKMDAEEPLLLSEGVCRQLGIITYHPEVANLKRRRVFSNQKQSDQAEVKVPTVRVKLLHSVRLLPSQVTPVEVKAEHGKGKDLLVDITLEPALIHPDSEGVASLFLTNTTGLTKQLDRGTYLGEAIEVEIVDDVMSASVNLVGDCGDVSVDVEIARQQQLKEILMEDLKHLSVDQSEAIISSVSDLHAAFALEEGERGETNLTQFQIETGNATPKRQPVRRIPFAVREEVNDQLDRMMSSGVIQPSNSPWASPIVLVRKRDGSMRFCVDYRQLNSLTKKDTFPLPRIDDLLDQLGKAQFFSTLDLASGYWQIRMAPEAQEKTAFVTHRGLFEFRVMPFGLTNAPAVFQRLMQQLLMPLNPKNGVEFVNVYIDDVIVFSSTLEEHLEHLKLVISRLVEAGLKLKPAKCHFARAEVEYLGHLVTPSGLKPTALHIRTVRGFPTPKCPKELRQFLGLASYYRRFIPKFAKIAHPLHQLIRKDVPFTWSEDCQVAFDELKDRLTTAPVLAYPDFAKDFVLETDASYRGLGAVLSQVQADGRLHPLSYASRALSPPETNYAVTELETLAVVWAMSHYRAYLYGHRVKVFTDHSAVKAVLGTPNTSGKHARWWTKVFASGAQEVEILYRAGKENTNADALSRQPQPPAISPCEESVPEVQVAPVTTGPGELEAVHDLVSVEPNPPLSVSQQDISYSADQLKDASLVPLIRYLVDRELPEDKQEAAALISKASTFVMLNGILHHVDPKTPGTQQVVVPSHLRAKLMTEVHGGKMSGHFSEPRLYKTLSRSWWWEDMLKDAVEHCKNCPQCAIVNCHGKQLRPPLQPIPVERAFQILGVDIMELPKTSRGNQFVIVFQDYLSKFPLVFPIPDQKTERIVRLLAEEVVPLFGVPEALLSDRGANFLSHLMLDVCSLLGITKLNTTAYHPQCDGMVECFNRTLKTMLRKHAADYGPQWDRYLPGVLWAYRNTPHESTGEKPSYLLFGMDCRSPSQAALLPPTQGHMSNVVDYREELTLMLAQARQLAVEAIQKAQRKYKKQYDRKTSSLPIRVGEWVLVKFPHDETGRYRKLSRPWHGPYRVLSLSDTGATLAKVYFPEEDQLYVHLSRVKPCPIAFPCGFYWYGGKQYANRNPPRWVDQLLQDEAPTQEPRYHLRSKNAKQQDSSGRASTGEGVM